MNDEVERLRSEEWHSLQPLAAQASTAAEAEYHQMKQQVIEQYAKLRAALARLKDHRETHRTR